MTQIPRRTQVAIIGGGPAGSLLAHLLQLVGVECLILELRSRQHVLERVRAGVIEHGSAEVLRRAGVGKRMDAEGFVHDGVGVAFGGEVHRIDFKRLTGKHVVIYGQTELQKDLYDTLDETGLPLFDEVTEIGIDKVTGDRPVVEFKRHGVRRTLECDFVAGCDGVHGITRELIPEAGRRSYERTYPFCWVGVLSETPPVSDELIYATHERGFALCSMRNEQRSRYYVQAPASTTLEEWPDQRFWEELLTRLPEQTAGALVTGPSIDKIITPLRSWVQEPMRHGRLFLTGDVAHIVPPTGAKGLNLAISDVFYLSRALSDFYSSGSSTGLDAYSETALARVWKAVRFSWWWTTTMHRFFGISDEFERRLQLTELEYLFSSETAQKAMAENYVGLPI